VTSTDVEPASAAIASGSGIEVRGSRYGRGVFATRRFAKGRAVEVCPTLPLPDGDVSGLLSDYVFKSLAEGEVLLILGYGMLYNHSTEPNLEYVQESADTMTFVALKAIRPGDELFIDYGEEWWDTRSLAPD
jgi:hypothetical protein